MLTYTLCTHIHVPVILYIVNAYSYLKNGVYLGGKGRDYNTAFTQQLWGNAWGSSRRWLKDRVMLVNPCKED